MPIISTMKSLRPVKRYFASATAARNASTIEIATATRTMIRLFFTESQKNGRWIASREVRERRPCTDDHVGVRLLIWSSGLNAVEIIQKTGKTMTTKSADGRRCSSRPCAARATSRDRLRPHHLPHVDEAHQRDDHEHQRARSRRPCRSRPSGSPPEEIRRHQVVARMDVRRVDQQVRLREDAEVPEDREAREDEQDRLQDRQRDVAEDAPRACRRRSRPPRRARAGTCESAA